MTADDEFAAVMEALRAEYRADLAQQIQAAVALWAQATAAGMSPGSLSELVRSLHKMAGAAGTFGFDRVSELAADAEARLVACCERETAPAPDQRAAVDALIGELRAELPQA
ncbi:MAG TPA: Hpt domain-containing protein [Burkholderiales bacterium]|nr:Hpt domain-containing protein [Burkholderiales bacterium]